MHAGLRGFTRLGAAALTARAAAQEAPIRMIPLPPAKRAQMPGSEIKVNRAGSGVESTAGKTAGLDRRVGA